MRAKPGVVVGLTLALAGCGDPNVYAVPQADAYRLLTTTKVDTTNRGIALLGKNVRISGDGTSKVYWNIGATYTVGHCEASISPEGGKSRLMAFCNGGDASSGAASGMAAGMMRNALIEHIDATLRHRPVSRTPVVAFTNHGWPADPHQPDGSYSTMVVSALKMDREAQQGLDPDSPLGREMARIKAEGEAQRRLEDPGAATRPMTQLPSGSSSYSSGY